MKAEQSFNFIVEKLSFEHDAVEAGKMMSAPGIQYKKKNFAFFHKGEMCFKLGKEYYLEAHGISEIRHLSPFKTKPPLTAWYYVGYEHADKWEELSYVALKNIKEELK